MIDNKFLYFQTYNKFIECLEAGKIDKGSIVFIEDRSIVWTHDKEYAEEQDINHIENSEIDEICT